MGVLNIITNVALIVFPIPMILRSRVARMQKITIMMRLALPLLSIGYFPLFTPHSNNDKNCCWCVARLTIYALFHIISSGGSQQLRTLFASLDILLATFTSNTIVLFSLLSDRGYKKRKFRGTYFADVAAGRDAKGRRPNVWGSDEDLMPGMDANAGFGGGAKNGEVVALRELGRKESRREREGSVQEPGRAKLQEIRVASTWDVRVDGAT
jgi:hypothetical protein